MKYFSAVFFSQIKIIKAKILLMFAIFLFILASAFFAYQVSNESLSENPLRLNVVVVNLDESPQTEIILNMILANDYMKESFNIQFVTSEESANTMLKSDEASASLVFPNGFLMGVFSGDNPSPTVTLNSSTPLEQFFVRSFAENFENVMVSLQSGVYTVLDFATQNNQYSEQLVLDVNLDYAMKYLNRSTSFQNSDLEYVDAVDIGDFYTTSIITFLLFLSSSLFFKEFNLQSNLPFYKFINKSGHSYISLYFIRLSVILILYLIIFLALFLFSGFNLNPQSFISLLNGTTLFVLLQAVLFNFSKNFVASAQLNILIHSLFLLLSGGIIPLGFMPTAVSALSIISPYSYLFTLFSSGFVKGDAFLDNIIVLVLNLILTAVCLLLLKKNMEATYANDYI